MKPEPGLQDNVEIPTRKGARSKLGKLLSSMGQGQSFVTDMNRATVYSLARYYKIGVLLRTEHDGQIRVWRIK